MAVAEPDPLLVIGCQPQIGAERWYPDGEHHHATRLCPCLQPSHCTTGEPADPPADEEDIESIDHCCKYVDPGPDRLGVGDHHQSLQGHAHVGGGTDAQLGKTGNADPGSFARWSGCESKCKRHRCPAATGDRRTTLDAREQLREGLVYRERALVGSNCCQRREAFGKREHSTNCIEQMFALQVGAGALAACLPLGQRGRTSFPQRLWHELRVGRGCRAAAVAGGLGGGSFFGR